MERRELKDLNLLDDFLFGSMVTHPEVGEEFSRELLKVILGKKFGKLKIVPQNVFYGNDTELHGARLDVCIEDDESDLEFDGIGTIYDIEPELKNAAQYVNALPKRVRFYHAVIDTRSLRSGNSYEKLKNVYIIMIMPFDPFGLKRMVYTIKNKCEEEPDMLYEDGARTIFLYTRGTEGNPPEELRQLLRYMECSVEENVKNESLARIHQLVEKVKADEEVSIRYMKSWEKEQMIRKESEERGRALGIEQGRLEERKRVEQEFAKLNGEIERLRRLVEPGKI